MRGILARAVLAALTLLSPPAWAQGVSIGGSGAKLTANTFTATQTINPAVNTSGLVISGATHTGSDATSDFALSTTLNTSGSPDVFKLSVTDTARGASTKLFNIYGGASGTTSEFSVDRSGNVVAAGTANVTSNITTAGGMLSTATSVAGYAGTSPSAGQFFASDASSVVKAFLISGGNGIVKVSSSGLFSFASTADASTGTTDLALARDAAGILAQRNSTNAQVHRTYNTFTDASNGEWGTFGWQDTANVLSIGTKANGTGVTRNMQFLIGGANKLDYGVTTAGVWTVATNMSGAQFTGSGFIVGGGGPQIGSNNIVIPNAGAFYWSTRSEILSPSDGVITVANNAGTDFGRLQFGGTTSSFPALKRSTTTLQARLADDSAFAPVQGKITTDTAYTAGTTTAAGYLTIYDSTGTAYKVNACTGC